jgi:transposase
MTASKHEAATVAATDGEASPRIEIVGERRRAHDAGFRARVVAESVQPGARIQDVARRHGICPSLIYRWRRVAAAESACGSELHLFPVRIATVPSEAPAASEPLPSRVITPRRTGLIEIELSGSVRVSVDEGVNVAALRRVLSVLRG